jgi:hypothetical protein
MHPDGGKTTDKSLQSDRTISIIEHESGVEMMQSDRTISIIEHESRVEMIEESQNLTGMLNMG